MLCFLQSEPPSQFSHPGHHLAFLDAFRRVGGHLIQGKPGDPVSVPFLRKDSTPRQLHLADRPSGLRRCWDLLRSPGGHHRADETRGFRAEGFRYVVLSKKKGVLEHPFIHLFLLFDLK